MKKFLCCSVKYLSSVFNSIFIDVVCGAVLRADYPFLFVSNTKEIESSWFFLKIHGVGGHGSAPQEAVDAIIAATQFVSLAQTIISRKNQELSISLVLETKRKG